MITTASIILIVALAVFTFMQQPKFGRIPKGERLKRIKKSPHYQNGQFHNLSPTPSLTEGANYFSLIKKIFFEKDKRATPKEKIPAEKTDLKNLNSEEDILIWFGHSSYFLQVDRKKILVDPVFSGSASPFSFTTKAFKGTDVYSAEDIPEIDYLFLTHDHWDHLDYNTLKKLKPKIKKIICGLGTAEHLERWNFDLKCITEEDWNSTIEMEPGFTSFSTPARHFSGRGFRRNKTLWMSFVLQTPSMSIFLGGDSGYDTHFAEIGKKFGPFDLAILENGQYNKHWKYIHMMPEEVIKAGEDLKAKKVLPVHNSKFSLSLHAWDEPLKRVTTANEKSNLQLITPKIGEKVILASINLLNGGKR